MRAAPPRSASIRLVLDGSVQTFNYTETTSAIAEAARTFPSALFMCTICIFNLYKCIHYAGLIPEDVVITSVTPGSVIVEFYLAYGSAQYILIDALNTMGFIGGLAVLGIVQGNNCSAFVPDSMSTMFPPALDIINCGFTSLDALHLIVKSPLVLSRSYLSFSLGDCMVANVTRRNGTCMDIYDIYVNWRSVFQNNCTDSHSFVINGFYKEYFFFLKAEYTETFDDWRKRDYIPNTYGRSISKRSMDRVTSESLAFRVSVPTSVSVTSSQQTLTKPTFIVKLMVISREFDIQTSTVIIIMRTKTQAPGFLILPRMNHTQTGLNTTIFMRPESNVTCPNNVSTDCIQTWEIRASIDTQNGVCKLGDTFFLTWNTSCHYPFWDSGTVHMWQ